MGQTERREGWHVRRLVHTDEIIRFLETDRKYAAYAIGDLEPVFFEHSHWYGSELAGQLRSLALLYEGLDPPALILAGEPMGIAMILRAALRPEQVMFTCRELHLPALEAHYHTGEIDYMLRMTLSAHDFRPVAAHDAERLGPGYAGELARLYAAAQGNAFSPFQLARGVFYGVKHKGQLVSAAGTHLVAPTMGVAAVGNVCTYPEYRGRGYATRSTSAVCADLLAMGLMVVLNVHRDNADAIHIYNKLGFKPYCPILEGIAVRKHQ
jgi:ribosomal protein S18 acetylase RimI-like enzyme